jgi:Domain of unknown function (DUF4304)
MGTSESGRLIDGVIRHRLESALGVAGYKRKGRDFWRVEEKHTYVLNVQASIRNTPVEAQFTINLAVYLPDVAALTGNICTGAFPEYRLCSAETRLGGLLPTRVPWWVVYGGSENEIQAVSQEVCDAWEGYGQPWLDRMSDLRNARAHTIQELRWQDATAISLVLGERDEARTHLAKLIAPGPHQPFTDRMVAWARSVGLDPAALD